MQQRQCNDLSYDGTTFITNTVIGRQYLGFDLLANLTYQQTVDAVSVGGTWEGWSIANTAVADDFIDALLGGPNACSYDSTTVTNGGCGLLAGWADGTLGDNFRDDLDYVFFVADETDAAEVGFVSIRDPSTMVVQHERWSSISQSDWFAAGGTEEQTPISWLLYKDASPVSATIDIKPSSDPNSVNPRSKGVVPVAVLGSIGFDATQVYFLTVTFGSDGASTAHDGHVEDINDDGFMDMVFHFKTQETGIVCGDTEATLVGETFGETQFTGTDTVNPVGCK